LLKTTSPNKNHHHDSEDVLKEIDILCGLSHPNVVCLSEYFAERGRVYLVTELVTGGELLGAVLARGAFGEADARAAFRQLLRGIEYLHSRWVVLFLGVLIDERALTG
jgi:serine/threonine protein kinase